MPNPEYQNYQPAKCCKTCADSKIDFSSGVRVCRNQFIVNDEMVCDSWQQPEFIFSILPQQFIEESEDDYGIS
jgi:hypothetical protein